ncbi:hypothetical protein FN846DRAFT_904685 [Sphaerosporella brunnea]|uniref:HTH TFE/IIEalpha-type domain-containing protein n=1 Tax=Sphaerosporella brunnea TaxID=1250544 RepID=A0A5J5F3Q8_9PEZI|nr:hypothetical protein FN846DRAFT_904685 [Sphaerosporella brunnea]
MSLDVPKALVRTVARAFYDTRHILVIDALAIHGALRDDELARLLGLVTKEVHKLCGRLKEDRMLAVHSRPEQKDGQQRPVNRTYYYIEYRSTIDGIKYRVYMMGELVRRSVNNGNDTKGYVCPHCAKRFAVLDAVTLDIDDAGMFLCDRCTNALVDDEESAETKLGHEKIQRMNRQLEKIERLLREVDTIQVPLNDFEHAIANAVPVPKDKNALASAAQFVPVTGGAGRNAAGKPSNSTAIEISITSSSEKTAEELRAEQLRKQQQAEKNALPVWHTQSTVTPGQITNAGIKEAAERAAREKDGIGIARREAEAEERNSTQQDGAGGDAIAQYYAALAAQKAQEEADERDEDSDEEDEDEEDEEFEDLEIASGAANTAVVTPAANGESEEDELPPGKKAKVVNNPAPAAEEDSDEEVDFEDV